jgi:ubiquinone/menaquinone biosynthesis C-methylase UbiE
MGIGENHLMDRRTQVARLFDEVADTYDAVGVEFFKPIATGLVNALAPRVGERAVDIGCGRGAVLLQLAAAVAPDGSVVGIDLSSRMVELASAEAVKAGLAVDVQVGDAMAPDLPSESFDLVSSSLVLFFLPDPLKALRNWRSLLVDGGRVGVSTFGPYDQRWREQVDGALHSFASPQMPDARTTGEQGPFGSDAAMEALLSEAGFHDVRTVTSTVSPRFDDPEHWYRWSMSVGQRQFWAAVPEGELANVREAIFAAVDKCRDEAGRIGFDQEVRYTLGVR